MEQETLRPDELYEPGARCRRRAENLTFDDMEEGEEE